jgi:serine/threonine-protein kinase
LAHPHIASVYDYGEIDDPGGQRTPFVVMELLGGTPLSAVRTPMPPRQAYRICAEIASALAAAHALGIVHRDVKPANVFITPVGVKVFDFGIAARIGTPDESDEVTGTPTYLAPERLLGDPVTPASDVYALGILLFGLLMSMSPWTTRSDAETIAAHLLEEPASLPSSPDIPRRVADLYRRCLARDPDQRPPAAEVAAVLAEAAVAEVTPDRRLPTGTRLAVLIGACALAIGAGHLAYVRDLADEPRAQAAPPVEASPSVEPPVPSRFPVATAPPIAPAATSVGGPVSAATPTAAVRTFVSEGGTVVAGCYGDRAYLLSWSASADHHVKQVEQGPANVAYAEFRSNRTLTTMAVACPAGAPVLTVTTA